MPDICGISSTPPVQRSRSPMRFHGSGRTSPKRCAWEGCVANIFQAVNWSCVPSRGDYAAFNPRSSPMNKICPSTSSLANHLTCPFWIMCRTSYPLNRPPRTNGGSKPLARIHAPFDRAMVLFHDIVQVWTCAASPATPQFSLLLQFGDHLRVGRIAVYIDYPRTGMTRRLQGFLEEALRCGRIPVCRKREINCGACGIDRSI